MMRCAFGSEPAKAALRVLYAFPADRFIAVVDREKAKGASHRVCKVCNHEIRVEVHESNHNVAVWFRRKSDFTLKERGRKVRCELLHPYDAALSEKLVIDSSDLNTSLRCGFPIFMTSTELDKYTVNGKYYITAY